jgi:NTE family protein
MSLPAKPSLALALGGGGARGLVHILVLEALDELGIVPVALAGTSIGAIIGAVYAAGHSGKDLRQHVTELFRDRTDIMSKLFRARVGRLSDLFGGGLNNPVMVDGEKRMPVDFEGLKIPFTAVSGDFYGRGKVSHSKGPLVPAVAASMAIPGLVKPVQMGNRILIDGAVVDPVPFEDVLATADRVLAINVSGGPVEKPDGKMPSALEMTFGASQIMQSALMRIRLREANDKVIVVEPPVDQIGALDFFAAKKIFASHEGLKDQIKALLQ